MRVHQVSPENSSSAVHEAARDGTSRAGLCRCATQLSAGLRLEHILSAPPTTGKTYG